MDAWPKVAFGLAVAFVLGIAIWVHSSAPCGMYKFTPNKDIPARCISHFNK